MNVPIRGFERRYVVNESGVVTNIITGRVRKHQKNGQGYATVQFMKHGRRHTLTVHSLVADAFIPNPDNLPMIDHIDDNKMNPCVSNLVRCTAQYNVEKEHAMKYKFIYKGVAFVVYNLAAFCREKGLSNAMMHRLWHGNLTDYKGYTRA